MRFDVITLFPEMFAGPLSASILKRAQSQGALEVVLHNLRDWANNKHKTVDDTPYGGGAGMVLKVDVLYTALEAVKNLPEVAAIPLKRRRTVLLAAQGKRLSQKLAGHIAEEYEQITLICGHYEGVDDRIRQFVDTELSIGDFVLTGGELAALVVIDTVTRLLPQVITAESPHEESFSIHDENGQLLLEYPHFTRPVEFKGVSVPDILLSGNHAAIATWRMQQAQERTQAKSLSSDDTL